MGNRKKAATKAKGTFNIKFRDLKNGRKSIYLDSCIDGKRGREFLKELYIIPETTTEAKEKNKETLRKAEAIKGKRTLELVNNIHGFQTVNSDANVLAYLGDLIKKKENSNTKNLYKCLESRLRQYRGDGITFRQVDKSFCLGFLEYLKTAKNRRGGLLAENTRADYMDKLKCLFNSAEADGIILSNPIRQVKRENMPKRRPTETRYLTIEEVKQLKNTAYLPRPDVRNAFLFGVFTGLRYSDVKSISWGQLKKDSAGRPTLTYTQKKTKKAEVLHLNKGALGNLPPRGEAKDGDLIFGFKSNFGLNDHLNRWVKLAGIGRRITFHQARHTFATTLLTKDATIEAVSKAMGHTEIRTTQRYAKVVAEKVREAVDLLDGLTD